ncbi:MAG: hypothetical protein JW932_18655 [Deltaproteobacteria bacterium]|nr:hypothetical protein [Deltaproteobacteria bacterium]
MKEKTKIIEKEIISPSDHDLKYFTRLYNTGVCDVDILRIKEIIDKTTDMIFSAYRDSLLSEPNTYIVQAVWAKNHKGKLSPNQKKIKKRIASMMNDIMEILDLKDINESQTFSIEYLIKGLAVSKISYLIEAFKNKQNTACISDEGDSSILDRLKSFWNA